MTETSKNALLSKSIPQLFRYGLVGIATNAAMYLVYLLITYLGVGPKKVMTMLYIIGALIGFMGHRKWTFAHRGGILGAGTRYVIAHIFGYLINFLILLMFVDKFGYSHRWVQAAAIIIVAGFLFVTFRYFVFPGADRD